MGRFSLSLVACIAILAAFIAAAVIWLVLTQPVTVVDAVNEGDVTPVVRDLAKVLYDALVSLLKYLQ